MAKLVKCKEHKEIFEIDDVHEDKSWIGNWETFVWLGYKIEEVEIIPFEELRDKYPVGPTMVVTVTSIVEGTKPRDIFYPEQNNPTQRNISILWMGDEKWLNDFGGTHIVGFHESCRPQWYPPHKIKLISFLKRDSSNEGIERRVEAAKNHPNNGGWWTILLHEPDAQRTWPNEYLDDLKRRVEEYHRIRAIDTDPWNHPVVAVYDMTSQFSVYPGWQNAFTGDDHDVFLIDCYAAKGDGSLDVKGMEAGGRLVEIGLSRSTGQFIPCIKACRLEDDKTPNVVGQWEWWDKHFGPLKACAFWSSGIGQAPVIGVYEDEKIAEQVKEVNRMLGLLK